MDEEELSREAARARRVARGVSDPLVAATLERYAVELEWRAERARLALGEEERSGPVII